MNLISRWSKIAARLPGRTDNEIKNHWNTHIKKKLLKMGIDPATHEPLTKQPVSEETTSNIGSHDLQESGNNCVPPETDQSIIHSEDTSSSQNDNCSSDESLLLDNICSNDSLVNSLWLDEAPRVDASWESPVLEGQNTCHNMGLPSLEENCAWLLDCQDFGIQDFGFDYFTDIELNVLNTLDMGEKQY